MLKTFDVKALVRSPGALLTALIVCFIVFNYRFFLADDYLPLHDTGDIFEILTTTYSNFLFTGDLPEWLPHGVYGYHTNLQNVLGLSPFTYAVMAFGKLFGVLDTLVLFKTVILAEITVFCLGFLLLANSVLENRYSALLALAAILMTTIVINQIYFSFRIFYLVPLLTYYILVFFRTGRASNIVMALMICFASLYGNLVYYAIYYAMYVLILSCVFFYIYRKKFHLIVDRAFVVAVSVAVLFLGVGLHLILTSTDNLTFTVTARDPVTLMVSLETFLEYGLGGIVKLLEMVMTVPFSTSDVTFHVPAAALVFAVYAVYREKSPIFYAFLVAFAVLLVFAWGPYSPLARIVYYVPGFSYIRHIGLLYAVPKMLVALLAGFGIRCFLLMTVDGGIPYRRERRFLVTTAVILSLPALVVIALGVLETDLIRWKMVVLGAAGFITVAVAAATNIQRRTLLGILTILIIAQGGLYSAFMNVELTKGYEIPPAIKQEIIRARPYAFDETRRTVKAHPQYNLWNAFVPGRHIYQTHMVHYAVLGIDPCYPVVPRNRVDNYSPGVSALAHHLFGPGYGIDKLGAYYKRDPDALFFRLVGCGGRAKLQFVDRFEEDVLEPAAMVSPETMAEAVLVERADTGERRLVRSNGGAYPNATSLASQGMSITHFSANRLDVKVSPPGPNGAWLVYADAFHPGWRAMVDGRPAPVWKANMAFKAVFLPPGTETISFDFTHPLQQAALWFVGLFAVAIILLGCFPGVLVLKESPSIPR